MTFLKNLAACPAWMTLALFLSISPIAAIADVQLAVTSYSMYNGDIANFAYVDSSYLPCPANDCKTAGALLSGGTGELTNGVPPTLDWDDAPPELWVGWDKFDTNGANPLITFNFAQSDTIHSVTVWFDNTVGYGGVSAPGSISVDGTNYTGIPQSTSGAQGFTISGLDLTGDSATVQLFQGSTRWIMIGQVTFDGVTSVSSVPEPQTRIPILVVLTAAIAVVAIRARKPRTSGPSARSNCSVISAMRAST